MAQKAAATNEWVWEDCGSNWLGYSGHLYDSFGPTWQALKVIGLCTDDEISTARTGVLHSLHAAVEQSRHQYKG